MSKKTGSVHNVIQRLGYCVFIFILLVVCADPAAVQNCLSIFFTEIAPLISHSICNSGQSQTRYRREQNGTQQKTRLDLCERISDTNNT